MTTETASELADRIIAAGNPLDNEQVMAVILNAWTGPGAQDVRDCIQRDMIHVFRPYFENMLALAQAVKVPVDPEDSLGIKVNLIDVFDAWGQREAKDTAMLIDLCLGAAIEQLVPMFHEVGLDRMWPAEVVIKAEALERLAGSGRILRLEAEPGKWSVRLLSPEGYDIGGFNEKFGYLGTLRRHLTAFYDYHSYYETMADACGERGSTEYHEERRKLGEQLIATLTNYGGKPDSPRKLAPGEAEAQSEAEAKASNENPPENETGPTPSHETEI